MGMLFLGFWEKARKWRSIGKAQSIRKANSPKLEE